ncbi:MAG: VWA domain-containing protein, partial [Arenibacterium sp.]
MSDDLDDLKAALTAETPKPDPAQKAANLALAKKNFDALQGSRDGARLTSDRPGWGFFSGVRNMFAMTTTRGGLAATSALVAVGLVTLTPLGEALLTPRDVSDVIARPVPEVLQKEVEVEPPEPLIEAPVPAPAPLEQEMASDIAGRIIGGAVLNEATRGEMRARTA